jgi:hypothetical protein
MLLITILSLTYRLVGRIGTYVAKLLFVVKIATLRQNLSLVTRIGFV